MNQNADSARGQVARTGRPGAESPQAHPTEAHPSGTHPTGTQEVGQDGPQVEQPQKVMRIGTMVKQLLEEVRGTALDEASRDRLREIHQSSVRELKQGFSPELADELERLALPFDPERTPSDAELRVAQAQLVGWLEGLFHGLQTALVAQQMSARAQLDRMRQGALPAGGSDDEGRGGQYL